MKIHPVILSGGAGTRLWPLSREAFPKQFLPLAGRLSPFRATLERLKAMDCREPPVVVANHEHRFLALHELAAAGLTARRVLLEPFGRNTAPAIALAAYELLRHDPQALMLVLPSDHDIPDAPAFAAAVAHGEAAARAGRLVAFGLEARWPETGYGYIERGEALSCGANCYGVARFVEKPELEIARGFVASGRHHWNSGVFLFGAARFVEELARLQPDLEQACRAADAAAHEEYGCACIPGPAFARCSAVSVDHAVLERTGAAAMVPASFRWSDLGSWAALWEGARRDGAGNAASGDVLLAGSRDCYVRSTRRLVAALGVKDLVIVETPDAVLVADRRDTQRVRDIVQQLKDLERPEYRLHRTVHRPWGSYEDIDAGERFRVKRLTVRPGEKLSLQIHHHRAEHWVVVSGTARIVRGDKAMLLTENQSTYIPLGQVHALENPGCIDLELIEVQSGAYLGEDDIVRLADQYGRAPAQ